MWIVYCLTRFVKAKILSAGEIVVEGKQYELSDFQKNNLDKKP